MRPNVDAQKIEELMEALGKEACSSVCIYFTGGARGFYRDLKDVEAMYNQKLFSLSNLHDCFEAI
ncbi:MAG: hypothetical protein ACRC6M_03525 [Microcystaceae cyanobacterium]